MSDEFKKIESLLEQLKEYANTRVAQLKFSVAQKLSKTIADLVATILAGLVFFAFFFFGSIAAAIAIGDWLGKLWLGFLLIAGIYGIIGIIIWKAKDRILQIPLLNSLLKQWFTNDEDNEDDNEKD